MAHVALWRWSTLQQSEKAVAMADQSGKQTQPDSAAAVPPALAEADDTYRCGTLRYTKAGLFVLFGWLLWGDFCFTLFEQVGGPDILRLYLQDNFHVSNLQLTVVFTAIPMVMGIVLGSIISFKSDRCRSRLGRRIPYMLYTTPFLCLFAAAIGYADDILKYLRANLPADGFISPFTAGLLVIGFLTIGYTFFNEFVGSVYYYLFADVVPPQYVGRFLGLFRAVGLAAGFLFNVTLAEYQLQWMKAIHIGIALLYFVGFNLMCWRVKEGQYPPVTDVTENTSRWDQVKTYFRQSFTHPIFLVFYAAGGSAAFFWGVGPARVFSLHVNQHQAQVAAHAAAPGLVALTPDGKLLATAGQDGLVKLWERGAKKQLLPTHTLHAGQKVLSLAASADGKLLVAGEGGGGIELWRVPFESEAQPLSGHSGDVRGITVSPDSRRIASASADHSVRLWDTASGACLKTLQGHTAEVNCVAFSADGQRLVSGGTDQKLIVWDTANGTAVQTLEGSPGPLYAACFAPALKKLDESERPRRTAAVWGVSALLNYFKDVFSNESLYDVPASAVSRITAEDAWVVAGGRDGADDQQYAKLRVWDLAGAKPLLELNGHKKAITAVQYKGDLRYILSGSLDGSIRMWDPVNTSAVATDQAFRSLSGYTAGVTAIACVAEGKLLVNASAGGRLHVWDIDEGISLRKGGIGASFFAVVAILLSYPCGMLLDRFHPVRVVLWMAIVQIPFSFLSFFFLQDYMSLTWLRLFSQPFAAMAGVASTPMLVALLPKDKFGQFCAANAVVRQGAQLLGGLAGAVFLDWVTWNSLLTDNFRYGYLLMGGGAILNAALLGGVYYYWKKLGGMDYIPPDVEQHAPAKEETPVAAK